MHKFHQNILQMSNSKVLFRFPRVFNFEMHCTFISSGLNLQSVRVKSWQHYATIDPTSLLLFMNHRKSFTSHVFFVDMVQRRVQYGSSFCIYRHISSTPFSRPVCKANCFRLTRKFHAPLARTPQNGAQCSFGGQFRRKKSCCAHLSVGQHWSLGGG